MRCRLPFSGKVFFIPLKSIMATPFPIRSTLTLSTPIDDRIGWYFNSYNKGIIRNGVYFFYWGTHTHTHISSRNFRIGSIITHSVRFVPSAGTPISLTSPAPAHASVHTARYKNFLRNYSSGIKQTHRETNHRTWCSVEILNSWVLTVLPLHTFVACSWHEGTI